MLTERIKAKLGKSVTVQADSGRREKNIDWK